jgi:hypothetical protein
MQPAVTADMQPAVTENVQSENVQSETPMPSVPVTQDSEIAQSLEPLGQEQANEQKEEEDTIKAALLEQLIKIKEQTAQIENQLANPGATATGGMMKKRKKTYFKKYKSKKSMKRRNKTSRNK